MTNPDCFANKNGKCSALNEINCDGCRFYKSRDAVENIANKTYERLRKKPLYEQLYIAQKVFKGRMPWTDYNNKQLMSFGLYFGNL